MTSLSHSLRTAPAAELPAKRGGPVVRFLAAVLRELDARRTIRALSDYEDERLRDIGLSRGEIARAVRGGRARGATS